MPKIVPVSSFRADIKSVSQFTDDGEVVVLTQNGRPKWAMIDYDTWNAAASAEERSFSRAIRETEKRETSGSLTLLNAETARQALKARRSS
ncbi:MAG: type II toxin-antitoxin system Phd/YefM family antitoxin [Atopobiaceae bacterium]